MAMPTDNNYMINFNSNNKKYLFNFKFVQYDIESGLLRFMLNYDNETSFLCLEYDDFVNFLIEASNDKYIVYKNEINDVFNQLLENLDFYIFGYNHEIKKFTYTNIKYLVNKISYILIKYNKNEIKNTDSIKNKIKQKLHLMTNDSNDITYSKDVENIFRKIWLLLDCLEKCEITENVRPVVESTFTIYDFIFDQNK